MARCSSTWWRPSKPAPEPADNDPVRRPKRGRDQYDVEMRFEVVQRLHAPVDVVEEALVDPRFIEALATLPKLGRPRLLEQRNMNDRIFQRVRYDFGGELSPTVKAFIDPAKLSWVEESTQDRQTHQTAIAIIPDYYTSIFECSGTIDLTSDPESGTTTRTATGEVVVRVPVFGDKAEAAIVSGLRDHAEREAEVLDEWVATGENHRSVG